MAKKIFPEVKNSRDVGEIVVRVTKQITNGLLPLTGIHVQFEPKSFRRRHLLLIARQAESLLERGAGLDAHKKVMACNGYPSRTASGPNSCGLWHNKRGSA